MSYYRQFYDILQTYWISSETNYCCRHKTLQSQQSQHECNEKGDVKAKHYPEDSLGESDEEQRFPNWPNTLFWCIQIESI